MAYVLKEKQREYQRLWAAQKKAKQRLLIERGDGLTNLSSGIVTWDQLQEGRQLVEKTTNWKECVTAAKTFILSRKTNRLAIAELADKATVIKHGGKRSNSVAEDMPTLKRFAEQCEIHHKTLGDWVRIKRLVIDLLPPDERFIDWQAARLAMEDKSGACKIALYRRYSAADGGERNSALLVRYARAMRSYLNSYGTDYLTPEEKQEVRVLLRASSRYFAEGP